MTINRRRGTAIVQTSQGILIASGKHKVFLLPGGKAESWESRKQATIRELKEETNLTATSCKFLFSYNEPKYTDQGDPMKIRNFHKVFLIKTIGNAKPNHHDVSYINYWTPETQINISKSTQLIINKFLSMS